MINSNSEEDKLLFLRSQMQLQEQLLGDLFKIETQLEVLLMVDFNEFATVHFYNYLCTLQSLVVHARELSEQLLNNAIHTVN